MSPRCPVCGATAARGRYRLPRFSWLGALERLDPAGRLLDIGCGTGFLVVARRRGSMSLDMDECAEATKHARERFGRDVQTGDFADFAADGRSLGTITRGTSSGLRPW